jgi:hypothetical protein
MSWKRAVAVVAGLGATVFGRGSLQAQTIVSADELAALKAAGNQRHIQEATAPVPVRRILKPMGLASPADAAVHSSNGLRDGVDLYNGLPSGGFYWYWAPAVYYALDDGRMGPAAAAVGGGLVTSCEFVFGLHGDAPGDVLEPIVFVSFWNAPPDPVSEASDPVVDPATPVLSFSVRFEPITLSESGDYVLGSGPLDLAAGGLAFGLDETFYVEILPAKLQGGVPTLDPNVFAVFSSGPIVLGDNQDKMWVDVWPDGDFDGLYDHPAELQMGVPEYEGQSPIRLTGEPCTDVTLKLRVDEPDNLCVRPGEPVTVTMAQSCLPGLVRGYQAFLGFDPVALSFESGSYSSEPFGLPVIIPIAAVGGEINLAAGIDNPSGQAPTSSSADLVSLSFTAGTVEGPTHVVFRAHDPATRFSDEVGEAVSAMLVDSPAILIDGTPPDLDCPEDVTVHADAGACIEASDVDPGWATAADALDSDPPSIEYRRSDLGQWNEGLLEPYPAGVTTITWRATDCAGNVAECEQTVEVTNTNEMEVAVQLEWPFAGTRCVTFKLWNCGTMVAVNAQDEFVFTNGMAAATVVVACGAYDCVTARDRLHSLRRTDENLGIVEKRYQANFTGDPASGGDWLVSGNLNGDYYIDILDFGVFSAQWLETYPGGAVTDCATAWPHADISGNGLVWAEDYAFISGNFLQSNEPNCCGAFGVLDPADEGNAIGGASAGPLREISVVELRARGLGHLSVGDLNGDGWLNEQDLTAFMLGARPEASRAEEGVGAGTDGK